LPWVEVLVHQSPFGEVMKNTYEYECWYFKQRAKSCIQCSFVGSTTDLNEWASAPVKTSGNLRNFQRPEVDGHAEDISNFFNQFDENSSPSGIVVGFRMPVECVGEDGSPIDFTAIPVGKTVRGKIRISTSVIAPGLSLDEKRKSLKSVVKTILDNAVTQ
jgi:hypothetical protein